MPGYPQLQAQWRQKWASSPWNSPVEKEEHTRLEEMLPYPILPKSLHDSPANTSLAEICSLTLRQPTLDCLHSSETGLKLSLYRQDRRSWPWSGQGIQQKDWSLPLQLFEVAHPWSDWTLTFLASHGFYLTSTEANGFVAPKQSFISSPQHRTWEFLSLQLPLHPSDWHVTAFIYFTDRT